MAYNTHPSEERNPQSRSDNPKSKGRPLSSAVHPKLVPIWTNLCFDTIENYRCYGDTDSGTQLTQFASGTRVGG